MLLPPDLRDWLPADHMNHFIKDAVAALDLSRAHTNERSTGSAQYPPAMMFGLLIYCYATAPRFRTASPFPAKSSAARTASQRQTKQLIPNLAAVSPAIGQAGKALVDTGYYSVAAVLTA